MPAHKNQHFVPRCALRPFSLNGEGNAINVLNIASSRPIKNAPVKGQCARDYLYAKDDLKAERFLSSVEGHYATIVSSLQHDKTTAAELAIIRWFIVIQMRRTKAAINQMRTFAKAAADKIYANHPDHKPVDTRTDRQVMWESMRLAARLGNFADDLKMAVLRNKTSIDFVTCDNPALLTNRFSFQKLHTNNFGISNSGAILSMPLTPRLSMICYDKGTYNLSNASGTFFIDLKSDHDVSAINELQYLVADQNIYFLRWDEAQRIESDLILLANERSKAVAMAHMFIRDDDAASPSLSRKGRKGERYRAGTAEEEKGAQESLVAVSIQHPQPSIWLSKLKLRDKPQVFSDGSAAGPLRKAEWLRKRAH